MKREPLHSFQFVGARIQIFQDSFEMCTHTHTHTDAEVNGKARKDTKGKKAQHIGAGYDTVLPAYLDPPLLLWRLY